MSASSSNLFESALALPETERADLAFKLLQSLTRPSEEITSEAFSAELKKRSEAYERGEMQSFSLDEARNIVKGRLAQERAK